MNWDALAAIAEALGAIGVVASLIYVGYQVRETRKAVRAATAQARTDLGVQLITSRYTSDIAELLEKSALTDTELSAAEAFKLNSFFTAHVRHCQNLYYQHREGLLDENDSRTDFSEGLIYRALIRLKTAGSESHLLHDQFLQMYSSQKGRIAR